MSDFSDAKSDARLQFNPGPLEACATSQTVRGLIPSCDTSQSVRGLICEGVYYMRAVDVIQWLRKQEVDFAARGWTGEARAMKCAADTIEEDWLIRALRISAHEARARARAIRASRP